MTNVGEQDKSVQLLSEYEKKKVLVDWNATQVDYPEDKCIHHLFEIQAEKTPHAVAIEVENERITYQKLNQLANRLAYFLQKQGVGLECPVAIYLEGAVSILAILAVWKAGGGYLPLDRQFPRERLRAIINDVQCPVLLTQTCYKEELPEQDGYKTQIICLDDLWNQLIEQADTGNPTNLLQPDNLAYIIYTSGSTGVPKGVAIPHRGLCNIHTVQVNCFSLQPGDRVLQFSSLSFDASVWEIIMALTNGATLCLRPRKVAQSGPDLLRFMDNECITVATLTPSVAATLPSGDLSALRCFIFAGEVCTVDLVKRWGQRREIWNAYGPTEGTICSHLFKCDSADDHHPPIGRAIANTQAFVLDDLLQPVAINETGRLYIAGFLARGYLHDPEQTKQKFIVNPLYPHYSYLPLLYDTGDLAHWDAQGLLYCDGRDSEETMFKYHGLRIDAKEVEAAMRHHPSISECAVIYCQKHLVACYTIREQARCPDQSELHTFLFSLAMLQPYMIPHTFVQLEKLPSTISGKVDRKALQEVALIAMDERKTLQKTRNTCLEQKVTSLEQQLCAIYQKVLNIEEVNGETHFYFSGGDSLSVVALAVEVEKAFTIQIEDTDVFDHPTVQQLAAFLNTRLKEDV